MWNVLQISDALDREFSSALNRHWPALGFQPKMSWIGELRRGVTEYWIDDPKLRVIEFPLQRGYSRFPISLVTSATTRMLGRLKQLNPDTDNSPVICTTPYWAGVAEGWTGPVAYYLTDLMREYDGANRQSVIELDRRMCLAADLVSPNSKRIASYLTGQCGCDPQKIQIIPNATRSTNVLDQPSYRPGRLPLDAEGLARPIAGVLGNLASNMDWCLLEQVVRQTPHLSWLFAGPAEEPIPNEAQSAARRTLMQSGERVRFVGRKHYGELAIYARSFDVAVLPYAIREPTLSGSSTRFYEHLAAGRPMVAVPGIRELYEKPPLVELVSNAEEMLGALEVLHRQNYNDGLSEARWQASKEGTWDARALKLGAALQSRCPELKFQSPAAGRSSENSLSAPRVP